MQPGQVVAGGGLARALRRLDHRAVGHHRRHVEHVLAHGAVAHGGGAGGARRGHAADGGLLGAGIDGEEQADVAQIVVELLARDAGLDHAVEVALVDGEHAVHAREVERQPAVRRVDVAFERGAGAERDDGHAMGAGHPHDLAHLVLVLDPDHGVGRLVGDPGDGVGMLAADRLPGLQPVAEALAQDGNGGGDIAPRDLALGRRQCLRNLLASSRCPQAAVTALRDATWRAQRCQYPARIGGRRGRTSFTESCSEVRRPPLRSKAAISTFATVARVRFGRQRPSNLKGKIQKCREDAELGRLLPAPQGRPRPPRLRGPRQGGRHLPQRQPDDGTVPVETCARLQQEGRWRRPSIARRLSL